MACSSSLAFLPIPLRLPTSPFSKSQGHPTTFVFSLQGGPCRVLWPAASPFSDPDRLPFLVRCSVSQGLRCLTSYSLCSALFSFWSRRGLVLSKLSFKNLRTSHFRIRTSHSAFALMVRITRPHGSCCVIFCPGHGRAGPCGQQLLQHGSSGPTAHGTDVGGGSSGHAAQGDAGHENTG